MNTPDKVQVDAEDNVTIQIEKGPDFATQKMMDLAIWDGALEGTCARLTQSQARKIAAALVKFADELEGLA